MKQIRIEVTGPIGSGKSTAMEVIANALASPTSEVVVQDTTNIPHVHSCGESAERRFLILSPGCVSGEEKFVEAAEKISEVKHCLDILFEQQGNHSYAGGLFAKLYRESDPATRRKIKEKFNKQLGL